MSEEEVTSGRGPVPRSEAYKALTRAAVAKVERDMRAKSKSPDEAPCPAHSSTRAASAAPAISPLSRRTKADLMWSPDGTGQWMLYTGQPRSHYHLFCSEKGNHAGMKRPDSDQMKFYYSELPDGLKMILNSNTHTPQRP